MFIWGHRVLDLGLGTLGLGPGPADLTRSRCPWSSSFLEVKLTHRRLCVFQMDNPPRAGLRYTHHQ